MTYFLIFQKVDNKKRFLTTITQNADKSIRIFAITLKTELDNQTLS